MSNQVLYFLFENADLFIFGIIGLIFFISILLCVALYLYFKEKKINNYYLKLNNHFDMNFKKILQMVVFLKENGVSFCGTVIDEMITQRMISVHNRKIGNIKKQFSSEMKIIKASKFFDFLLNKNDEHLTFDKEVFSQMVFEYNSLIEAMLKTRNGYNKNIKVFNRVANISLANRFFGNKFEKSYVFWD